MPRQAGSSLAERSSLQSLATLKYSWAGRSVANPNRVRDFLGARKPCRDFEGVVDPTGAATRRRSPWRDFFALAVLPYQHSSELKIRRSLLVEHVTSQEKQALMNTGRKTAFENHRPQPPESNRAERAVRVIKQQTKNRASRELIPASPFFNPPQFSYGTNQLFILHVFACLLRK
jgi:hypothetical protein